MKIFTSLYYNASGVPYIKLTDSMDASDLKKIANVLGIYSIKANEFCISKKKALICNLDFVDIISTIPLFDDAITVQIVQ